MGISNQNKGKNTDMRAFFVLSEVTAEDVDYTEEKGRSIKQVGLSIVLETLCNYNY